jgi:hypothetical protein
MLSLQRKQVAEILDEDRRINHRVLDREKEQVKVFTEQLKPKGEADLETEVSFEKDLEKLQGLLEQRISSAEDIIRSGGQAGPITQRTEAFNTLYNSAPLVASYNGVVRSITDPSVSNQTREAMKAKMGEIQNLANALVYGYTRVLTRLTGVGIQDESFRRFAPRLVSAQAVVALIQAQLFRNSYSIIRKGDVEAQISDLMASYPRARPEDFGTKLDTIFNSAAQTPFFKDFGDDAIRRRAAQLAAEQGHPLSQDEFRRLSRTIFGPPAPMPIDPALEAELQRMGRVETAAKEEIGRRATSLPEPYRPPPTYSMLSPEFVAGIERTAEEERALKLDSDRNALRVIVEKYSDVPGRGWIEDAALPGGVAERDNDIDELIEDLIDVKLALANATGVETTRAGVEAAVRPLVGALVGATRASNAQKRLFRNRLVRVYNDYIADKAKLLAIEKDERVKQAKLIPKIGSAKPRFGRLGMWYNDALNDPYLVRSSV